MSEQIIENVPLQTAAGRQVPQSSILETTLQEYSLAGFHDEYMEYDASNEECVIIPAIQRSEEHPDVESYIPQYVQPKRLQIISEEELAMFQKVRKQNFEYFEKIRGRYVNILEGLELHTDVFSENEQKRMVKYIFDLRERGREGLLKGRTYSEPRKWMKDKSRITIQYGCCYNYAYDKRGNPPRIIRHDEVDPLPPLMKRMIKMMVEWRILPVHKVPNSCIINIYEERDCIPPHIDNHDFVRPFCIVSLISKCNIMFGKEIRVIGPAEFRGAMEIPLPVGSVLLLKGNGADLAKHCVPGVPQKRISITFRRMDDSKVPFGYQHDPELEELRPLEL
ncbi:RNA demethylase ALKBH5-like [Phalaenopsis equestris]|uniref:RNA demethylase ALKBH5-like n=1 Tax=Phalaenopsis equestris TaxID=78828 RepID=UPI0009E21044|nr:RNA demethylase ALKBH5-like [Phalaenopsis equestris]